MNSFWIISFYGYVFVSPAIAGTIQRIYTKDNQPAVKGASIKLVCDISQFSNQDTVYLYKTDAKLPSGSLGRISSLTQCFPSTCLTTTTGRYTFSADSSHVYIDITNINRSEDRKWWTCAIGSQRKGMQLTIYTVPQTLQFDSPPSQDQDLAVNTVTISCSTGCAYPPPSFTWFFTESGGSRQEWSSSGSVTDKAGGCTDSERIYTSTLSLARYTTFPGNVEKTVGFICGITSFTGMTQPVYTNQMVDVQFAVRVASVTLKDGAIIASEPLPVTSGVSKTMTCTSVSRPTATVVWYIGTEEKHRSNSSNSFTFTPQISDGNKKIFCKAFNTQPESEAVTSNKATLYVRVPAKVQSFYIEGHFGQTNVTVDEHDTVKFKCIVDSTLAPTIKIMFASKVLKVQVNESSLSFVQHDATCFDDGVYICEGSNGYGKESSHNVTLFVRCFPRPFRKIQRNITSYLDVPVTLSFNAIAYPEPGPKGFSWHKEDTVGWRPLLSNADMKISSSPLQSNLTLMNLSKEDYGLYRVTITNTIGTYEEHFFLSEKKNESILNTCLQQTDRDNYRTETSDTALIVGITLGLVCCALAIYATYLTILKIRTRIQGTRSLQRSAKQTTYANETFAADITEHQKHGVRNDDEEASAQQYTELSRYENTDRNTYDVINKT